MLGDSIERRFAFYPPYATPTRQAWRPSPCPLCAADMSTSPLRKLHSKRAESSRSWSTDLQPTPARRERRSNQNGAAEFYLSSASQGSSGLHGGISGVRTSGVEVRSLSRPFRIIAAAGNHEIAFFFGGPEPSHGWRGSPCSLEGARAGRIVVSPIRELWRCWRGCLRNGFFCPIKKA